MRNISAPQAHSLTHDPKSHHEEVSANASRRMHSLQQALVYGGSRPEEEAQLRLQEVYQELEQENQQERQAQGMGIEISSSADESGWLEDLFVQPTNDFDCATKFSLFETFMETVQVRHVCGFPTCFG